MRRRQFMAWLGSAVLARPLVGNGQTAPQIIGFLHSESADGYARFVAAFRRGLEESGYVEGRNVTIDYRWAESHYERLPALAADLIRSQVRVIFANSPGALLAKAATTAIPIVFTAGFDPVQTGLVSSLARPGGNITGAAILNVAVGQKQLELLHECVPKASVIGVLINPANPNAETMSREVKAAARTLGLTIHIVPASTESDLEAAFASFRHLPADALLIGPDPFFNSHSAQLAAFAVDNAMPAIFHYREFVAAGGMMSYGGNITEAYRWAGVYTGRILAGADPANLPIHQTTTFELIVNLKTAKALGVTVPPPLLARADEVIE